jgi:hypothetical protein
MLFSLSYGAWEFCSRKNDSMVTYFYTGLEFHSCIYGQSMARGGSDTDGHLNLEDQLDSAQLLTQCGLRGTCKVFL